MSFDLATFHLSEMTRLGGSLRRLGQGADSMEGLAQQVVSLLYNDLIDANSSVRNCVLVRFYITANYGDLDAGLRAFGEKLMQGYELSPATRCLTLLATAGDLPEWNSRTSSAGHQTIPLPSEQVIQTIPMVAQLIAQLGLDFGMLVTPNPALVLEVEQRTYNVFFVPDAAGSPYIPAQDFVVRHKVRSVLGFGGVLPSGEIYAVLMFTRISVSRDTANVFRNAAMNLKLALLPFMEKPLFSH